MEWRAQGFGYKIDSLKQKCCLSFVYQYIRNFPEDNIKFMVKQDQPVPFTERKHRGLKSWASPRVLQDAQGHHFGYSFKDRWQSNWKVNALKPNCTLVWNLQKSSKMAHEFSNELRTFFIQENQFEIFKCWILLSRDTSTRSKVFQICPESDLSISRQAFLTSCQRKFR